MALEKPAARFSENETHFFQFFSKTGFEDMVKSSYETLSDTVSSAFNRDIGGSRLVTNVETDQAIARLMFASMTRI